jgi:NADH-quinone oxidoreductase subunit L
MHQEQDIQHYGGLKKYMPKTAVTFLIAALAISGIPPLSGFFSKDEILWYSFANGGFLYWLIGALTALITAFYMFRLYFLTFEGKERFVHKDSQGGHDKHPHESPSVMTIPLIILGALSIIGGFIGIPEIFSGEHGNLFHNWLSPIFRNAERKLIVYGTHTHFEEILLMALSVAGAAASIFFARYVYLKKPSIAVNTASKFKTFYKILWNKYFVDEVYDATVINPIVKSSDSFLWRIADNKIIDGLVNGTATIIGSLSGVIRKLQTGVAQFYAVIMMVGIAAALFWIIMSL